jgi:hypothetical protein
VEAKLSSNMVGYEKEENEMPPGAIGILGAGRSQHSTSLVLGDPACYAYANSKTPKKKAPSSSGTSSNTPKSTVQSHNNAAHSIKGMDYVMKDVLENLKPKKRLSANSDELSSLPVEDSDKSSKCWHLENRKSNLMTQIKVMKDLGEDYGSKYVQLFTAFDKLKDLDSEE